MSNWAAEEMVESQMHDMRHAKRLTTLLTQLSEQPVSSIPRACQGWAETVAAYRFLGNPQVGLTEILSGHQHATLERVQAEAVAEAPGRETMLRGSPETDFGRLCTFVLRINPQPDNQVRSRLLTRHRRRARGGRRPLFP